MPRLISQAEFEAAVTAASEHIAPCGHNELGDIFDAVLAAFHVIDVEIDENHLDPRTPEFGVAG